MDHHDIPNKDLIRACFSCAKKGYEECNHDTIRYYYKTTKQLAPSPDGWCYGGHERYKCPKLIYYGSDCNGFT